MLGILGAQPPILDIQAMNTHTHMAVLPEVDDVDGKDGGG